MLRRVGVNAVRNVSQTFYSSLISRFNQPKLLFLLSVGVLVVLGSMLMPNTGTTTMNGHSSHGLNTVQITDVVFPIEAITKLNIPLEDLEKQPNQQIENSLMQVENKDPNIRFVYIHTKNEDEIYCIIVDFEPVK